MNREKITATVDPINLTASEVETLAKRLKRIDWRQNSLMEEAASSLRALVKQRDNATSAAQDMARVYLRKQGEVNALTAQVDRMRMREQQTSPYFSPGCPEGFDTVLGYLSKIDPEALDLMDKTPQASLRDGFWLTHQAKKRGMTPVKVPSPVFLRALNIAEVNSYPVCLLRERFGE